VLRSWGYKADARILCAADYGVPQTRYRAILIAHRERLAWPEPTHAEKPEPSLFGVGLKPWVTMAEALGWEPGQRAWDRRVGGFAADAEVIPDDRPAPTVTLSHGRDVWVYIRPSTTVAADPRIGRPGHKDRAGGEAQFQEDSVRVEIHEAAILQGFPADYPWQGSKTKQFEQVGNAVPPPMAAAICGALEGVRAGREAADAA